MPRIDRDDRGLTLRAMSTVALVGVLATGCDSQPRDGHALSCAVLDAASGEVEFRTFANPAAG